MSGFAFGPAHATDTVVKLGFAAPLTGPQSHYGEDMKNGLTLALEEANTQNIQLDGKTAKFELVSRDDQADPRTAVQVAQQIVDEGEQNGRASGRERVGRDGEISGVARTVKKK